MKILSIQIVIAVTLFGVSIAHNNYAQILDKPITVSLRDVPFNQALKQLEQAADVKFAYSLSQLDNEESVTLVAENKSLRSVLDEVFVSRNIKYTVYEKEGMIALKKFADEERPFVPAETKKLAPITGTVMDAATKQPMAGVNILIKGTLRGTTTDADGKFKLEANKGEILTFSFIGFIAVEVMISETVIVISLEEDVQSLKEVVINAGYYTTTKEKQTGNISKVTAREIEKQPVSNPLAALQGVVPGLSITQNTGVAGGNFTVRIRGQNSIGNGNDPLYIIDGVPFTSNTLSVPITSQNILFQGTSPLNMLNPGNIESIEILKDADATSIYGSRGSNGVILITTKKGKPGKTKVDFNFYSGAAQVASKMKMLSTSQYISMRKEAFRNDGIIPSASNAADLILWDTTRGTDWQKELIGGTAQTHDAQLNFSGGSENVRYNLGGSYHRETSVFPGSNADGRLATHFSMDNISSDKKLKTSFSISYSINDSGFINRDMTSLAVNLAPNAPQLFNEFGEFNWGADGYTASNPHPLQHLKTSYDSKTKNLLANARIEYTILRNLDAKISLGYTDLSAKAITTTPLSYYAPQIQPFLQNGSSFSNSEFGNWSVEPQLNWKVKAGSQSNFDFILGSTFLSQITESSYLSGSGFVSEALMKDIRAASTIAAGPSTYGQYRYQSIFTRLNYSFQEKYILNLTGRRDGSSRFGSDNRYANFGAIGAAWIFSREPFFSSINNILSFGKLRGSYGVTGNDQLGDYVYLDTYTVSRAYQNLPSLNPVRLHNTNFAWETNKKFETSIDLGFLEERVTASVSYYNNVSSNQLVGIPLPPTTGFATIQTNSPSVVRNSGWEIELSTQNIATNNFSWTTAFNISLPKNELVEFPGLDRSSYATTLEVGEPLSIKKSFTFIGVDGLSGMYQFEDVNGDGILNVADRTSIKFIGQKYFGGLQNTIRYKSLELTLLLQFVKQQSPNYISYIPAPGVLNNQPVYITDRWQGEGDQTGIQKYTVSGTTFSNYNNYYRNSEQSVSDASFLRLKNLSISYTFKEGITEKLHMNNARIFVQGQNLFTVTSYEGLDPETTSLNLPPLRVLTCGLSLTF